MTEMCDRCGMEMAKVSSPHQEILGSPVEQYACPVCGKPRHVVVMKGDPEKEIHR